MFPYSQVFELAEVDMSVYPHIYLQMFICICQYMYTYISVSLALVVYLGPLIESKEILSGTVEIRHYCSITLLNTVSLA